MSLTIDEVLTRIECAIADAVGALRGTAKLAGDEDNDGLSEIFLIHANSLERMLVDMDLFYRKELQADSEASPTSDKPQNPVTLTDLKEDCHDEFSD